MADNKVSILIVQPWLDYRGAERQSIQMLQDLRDLGVEVRLLCLYVADSVKNEIDERYLILPIKFIQQLMKSNMLFIIFGFWVMLYLILKYGRSYKIFNAHNFPSVWVCVIAKNVFKNKVAWVVHNFPQHPFRGLNAGLFELLIRVCDRYLVSKTDFLFPVSNKVNNQVWKKYNRTGTVLYPGLDYNFFYKFSKIKSPRIDQLLADKIAILQVGRICEDKKQGYTLEIFRKVKNRFPKLVLVFAGDGEIAIEDELKDKCIFLGITPREELAYVYSKAQFLFYPSNWGEGCTVVPFEAVISGTENVILAKNCGADEILTNFKQVLVFDPLVDSEKVCDFICSRIDTKNNPTNSVVVESLKRESYAQKFLELSGLH